MTTATTSKELIAELEGIRTKMAELAEKPLDADGRTSFDEMNKRAGEIRTEITAAQEDEQRRKDASDLDRFINEPANRLPVGVNNDDDTKKGMLAAGWEVKNGSVMAPTSTGKSVAMFAEEVLFGDMPEDDADAADYFKKTRAIFAPGYRKAYEKFLRTSIKYRSESIALSMLEGVEQKALSEGIDTAGGFLVPPDIQAEILVRLADRAVLRANARVVTTSRDKVVFPRVQANATSGSIYSSGFVGDWAGETPAFTDVDAAFGTFEVAIKKARIATKLSNDFIADAVANVLAFLAQNGAANLALVEDNGFITGAGDALRPKGILNSGATTVDVEGTTANTITGATALATLGTYPKIINMIYAVPPQYRSNAKLLMSPNSEGKVRNLTDVSGRPIWLGQSQSGFGGTPGRNSIEGFEVINSQFMPNDGTDLNKVFVFGDFTAYIIAQRAQISTVVLRERFADTDQTGIILFERVGGDTWNEDAIRIGVV